MADTSREAELEARVAALETELELLKRAFFDAMADPPLTGADKALMIAEILDALGRGPSEGRGGDGA